MNPEREVARNQASEDLIDIASLLKHPPFSRYFVRQLKRRRETLLNSLVNDPPSKVDAAEREIIRRLIKQLDEIDRMPAEHAASAEALLRQ